jgi:CheY-like chemotaxis protein/anti-sigma regulatory factor (Ser/Thr protein kinase)
MERILLVDDERALKTALAKALRQDGYEVLLADSAEEALVAAEQHAIDLLLTDVRMPGTDGLELLRALRERQPWVAAIVMTAYGSVQSVIEAMRLGASDFLTKPFKLAALRHAVACALAARPARPRAESVFALADVPHEFSAPPGATGWLYDLWRVGPGRRGVLFAAAPAAGRDVVRALVRAEAAHHGRPQCVLADAGRWLGAELAAFCGVVDIAARVLRFACGEGVAAHVCGSGLGARDLTGHCDDIGVAIQGDDQLIVASDSAAAAAPAGARASGAVLRVSVGALVGALEEETLALRAPCAPEDYIERTEALAARAGFDEEDTFRLVASVTEAVDNAQRHAYAGQSDGLIEIRYLLTPGELVVHVADAGRGFDAGGGDLPPAGADDLLRESGRGLLMMHRLMDAVEVESASDRGTTVRMEKGRSRGDRGR